MVVVKLSMFVLEGCKPPVDLNLQRGYRLYVQEKITMHTSSYRGIQEIRASMEFEGNQFSTDIFVNTVTGEVLQRACSCKSFDGMVAGRKPTCDTTEQCNGMVAGRKPTHDETETEQWKCDNLCDHEAAALFKYVNEGLKENSPPKSPPKSSGSGFWRIGLPIMAGVTAAAAAPLVLTAVGFTSAGIAAGSWAASMMSSAAVANGGGVAAGGKTMESDGEIDEFVVEPYQFEPSARQRIDVESSSDSDEDSESDRDKLNVDERIGNVAWCSCEHCVAFPTAAESRCCREYAELEEKLDQQQFSCITFNDGFIGNCLNPDVIEVSFYEFLQTHGPIGDEKPIHEVYRYIAYRRLARWI